MTDFFSTDTIAGVDDKYQVYAQSPITIVTVTVAALTKVMFCLINQFKSSLEGISDILLIIHLHCCSHFALVNCFQFHLF